MTSFFIVDESIVCINIILEFVFNSVKGKAQTLTLV